MVRDYFEKACQAGRRLLLILDEFERLLQGDPFDVTFFTRLRSLANDLDLAWVTTSLADPFAKIDEQADIQASPIQTSPFGNIFLGPPLYVGALSVDDARRLVAQPAARRGCIFGDADVEYVIDMAGRLPYALQAAASGLYDAYGQGKTGKASQALVRARFDETVAGHFERWWRRFTPEQQQSMAELAAGTQSASQKDAVVKSLINYGFLEQTGGGYRVFGSAFAEWIQSGAERPRITVRAIDSIAHLHPLSRQIHRIRLRPPRGEPPGAAGGQRQETICRSCRRGTWRRCAQPGRSLRRGSAAGAASRR